ncbi:MAG: diadenylate cyclase CdaA [Proteobacteria bacterium]|nr:diadenylate cyclase CdaA [Pseudomonadota bacterium]
MIDSIFTIFEGFTTSDWLYSILDILIVAYLIYQILMLIRGTKAMQILFGLLIFVALYLLSNLLDLVTLNWLLEKFIGSFIIIIVIIFQEDIRRGLSEFGKTGSLSTTKTEDRLGASPIEEIVKAASILSERKIGALIAIEMDASLDQYMVEGVRVDASISKELLVALFIPYKANPTHDGAVIIRNHRIDRAACFLPLSANDQIDKALGTRHRAAIGLSESTDAVIVVVSEETGAISIAHNEQLLRKLTPEALRDELHKLFVSNEDGNSKTYNGMSLFQRLKNLLHLSGR